MDSIFGLPFGQWMKLLKDNNFDFPFSRYPIIIFMTLISLRNSLYLFLRNRKYNKLQINELTKDPIFILGHWRSGTTFLHNLLTQDDQFIYPRLFEVINPFTFEYVGEKYISHLNKREVTERPMDNVKSSPFVPGEEEFALAALTLKSPLVAWAFPKKFEDYETYLTLKGITNLEKEEWKSKYKDYLERVNNNRNQQLVLKSPTNTSRIDFLLELYPNAKFINIHRNPVDVFSSTKKLYSTAVFASNLQPNYDCDEDERIIRNYKIMYKEYFKSLKNVKESNFINISFEELEENPFDVIKNIYESINIEGFDDFKPKLENYIKSLKSYKKNKHKELDENILQLLRDEWKDYYSEWGYTI